MPIPVTLNPFIRSVELAPSIRVISLTIGQAHALNRLGLNGWDVDLADFTLSSDGMLEGFIKNKGGSTMYVGIHPSGSTHT